MSTYYYMVCDKHREKTDAASHGGCIGPLCDSPHTLLPFIVTHCGCPVRIISEHSEDAYDSGYTEWTKDNLQAMRSLDRDEPDTNEDNDLN